MLLVKNATVYAPEALGAMDILVSGGHIIALAPDIDTSSFPCEVEILDARGQLALHHDDGEHLWTTVAVGLPA